MKKVLIFLLFTCHTLAQDVPPQEVPQNTTNGARFVETLKYLAYYLSGNRPAYERKKRNKDNKGQSDASAQQATIEQLVEHLAQLPDSQKEAFVKQLPADVQQAMAQKMQEANPLLQLVNSTDQSHQLRIQQIWGWPEYINPTKKQCDRAFEDAKKEYAFYERHLIDLLIHMKAGGTEIDSETVITQKRKEFNAENDACYRHCLKHVEHVAKTIESLKKEQIDKEK